MQSQNGIEKKYIILFVILMALTGFTLESQSHTPDSKTLVVQTGQQNDDIVHNSSHQRF